MDFGPGSVIAGRYRVDKRVGAGGMGEVWAGEHLAIGVKIAVKTLLPAAKVSHEVVARFKREAFLLGRIRSEYVARVLDFVNDENLGLVIVMEFIEGDSLAKVLSYKRLSVEESVDLGADVASALCDLHRAHVVHRDLKPGNIILQPLPGGRKRAVVVDFGVSRMISAGQDEDTITGITRANMAVGTVEYMAPEQILNSRDVTGGSDCYALGAIIYRALAGRHVYGDVFENELAHIKLTQDAPALETGRGDRVARSLAAVVARALRRRPTERYSGAEEMLAELTVLRDLARVAAFEMADSTTTTLDQKNEDMVHEAPTSSARAAPLPEPPVSGAGAAPPPSSVPLAHAHSIPGDPFASQRSSQSGGGTQPIAVDVPRKRRRGLPRPLVAAAVLAALATGGALGVYFAQRTAPAEATAAPSAPEPVPEPAAQPAPAPEPAPTPTTTAAVEVDLGDLDTVPLTPQPRATGSPGLDGAAAAARPAAAGGTGSPATAAGAPRTPSSMKPSATAPASAPVPMPPRVAPPPVERIEF